jgi:hypothetical protein
VRAEIDAQCARSWRAYDRRLGARYGAYFAAHPELAGDKRGWARDLEAALPPGWGELAAEIPTRAWERRHLSGKSTQTLSLGLLGVAARRDPSLRWLFGALGLPRPRDPVMEFGHSAAPGGRPAPPEVLVHDERAVVSVAARRREAGVGACSCRAGPGEEGRCSPRVAGKELWEAARELFEIPPRAPGAPCQLSAALGAVRAAAAARTRAADGRLAVLALIHDADNPYFGGCGDWAGWPAALVAAAGCHADRRRLAVAAISWQELLPRLPLDGATRAWARERHGLGVDTA